VSETPAPEQITEGAELAGFSRQTGFHNWNRYAAVNDEFVSIHMDDDAGRGAGYMSAFGMGNLQWAYLHNLLRAWMGDQGRILNLSCQFRGANVKGQTVTAKGVVSSVRRDSDRMIVELDLWTEEQSGKRLAPGHAVVELPLTTP
jgi:hypothetical protein